MNLWHPAEDYEVDPGNAVVLTWAAQGDGTGLLAVRAASKGFAGESSAWFDSTRLLRFAAEIDQYPLGQTVGIASGYGESEATLTEEHVRLEVYPVGVKGQVGVRVRLATVSTDWPLTRPASRMEVRLELLTTYQRMGEFSRQVEGLIRGLRSEASVGMELLA